jgi:hypothetical protein
MCRAREAVVNVLEVERNAGNHPVVDVETREQEVAAGLHERVI